MQPITSGLTWPSGLEMKHYAREDNMVWDYDMNDYDGDIAYEWLAGTVAIHFIGTCLM